MKELLRDEQREKREKICPKLSFRQKTNNEAEIILCFEGKCAWWDGMGCSQRRLADIYLMMVSKNKEDI